MKNITKSIKISTILSGLICLFFDHNNYIYNSTIVFLIINCFILLIIINRKLKKYKSLSSVVKSSYITNKYLRHFHPQKMFYFEKSIIYGFILYLFIGNNMYYKEVIFSLPLYINFTSMYFLEKITKRLKPYEK